jgi:hypothetical protein
MDVAQIDRCMVERHIRGIITTLEPHEYLIIVKIYQATSTNIWLLNLAERKWNLMDKKLNTSLHSFIG